MGYQSSHLKKSNSSRVEHVGGIEGELVPARGNDGIKDPTPPTPAMRAEKSLAKGYGTTLLGWIIVIIYTLDYQSIK